MGILRSLAKKVLGKSESAKAPAAAPATPSSAAAPSSAASGGAGTEKPWYLDGTNDGWDTTDVTSDAAGSAGPAASKPSAEGS